MKEVDRIVGLPARVQGKAPPPRGLLETWAPHLRDVQVEALSELAARPAPLGIYGDIPVGGGKFLIATLAGAVAGAKRPVVLTQPDLIAQAEREFERFAGVFVGLREHKPRFLAYSTLSSPKKSGILWRYAPDLIALDEAHAVVDRTSARTKRLIDYAVNNPECRIIVLSGTLTRRNIEEVAHLAEMALRDGSWLPLDRDVLSAWGTVLNRGAQPDAQFAAAHLGPLLRWAKDRWRAQGRTVKKADEYREAYRERFLSTPGVVSAPEADVPSSLYLRWWRPLLQGDAADAMKALTDLWILPDGTEVVDALEWHRHAASLSVGYYYRPLLDLGNPEVLAWMEERRLWGKALRRQIEFIAQPGIDSPATVEAACVQGRAHPDTRRAFARWAEVRDAFQPASEPVWVDESVVRGAVEHTRGQGRCILWYDGARAMEPVLRRLGVPTFGAGTDAPSSKLDVVALSRRVHGTGKNLQAWHKQIVFEPPAGATAWEQMIGRTHRPGQEADAVYVDICGTTPYLRSRVYAAIDEANYVAQTSSKRPKLLIASWAT